MLIVNNLNVRDSMKKPSLKFVEQHTVSWVMNRLEEVRRDIDSFFDHPDDRSDREIEEIVKEVVDMLEQLLELYKPFEHVVLIEQYQYNEDDVKELVEWARNFISENDTFTQFFD